MSYKCILDAVLALCLLKSQSQILFESIILQLIRMYIITAERKVSKAINSIAVLRLKKSAIIPVRIAPIA